MLTGKLVETEKQMFVVTEQTDTESPCPRVVPLFTLQISKEDKSSYPVTVYLVVKGLNDFYNRAVINEGTPIEQTIDMDCCDGLWIDLEQGPHSVVAEIGKAIEAEIKAQKLGIAISSPS
jgi:hypothetical protein